MRLERGAVVLITGASSGIGRQTALAFARAGARLFLVARRRDVLETVGAQARQAGASAVEPFPCDLAVPGTGTRIVEECEKRLGAADVLVANAGYGNSGSVETFSPEQMNRIWQVNYQSGYESIHAAIPGMKKRGRGHIFLVSSVVGRRAIPYAGPYCVTKFAQAALAEALHFELAPAGIGVTAICPGRTRTEFFDVIEKTDKDLPTTGGFQDPAVVARGIVRAVGGKRREIRFTLSGKAGVRLSLWAPWIVDRLVEARVRSMRRSAKTP